MIIANGIVAVSCLAILLVYFKKPALSFPVFLVGFFLLVYLKTKGFKARYLEDGLTGLAEYLRGDKARDFIK